MAEPLQWMSLDRNILRSSGPVLSEHGGVFGSPGNEHILLTGTILVMQAQSTLRSPTELYAEQQ